jgi:hypothetical protein
MATCFATLSNPALGFPLRFPIPAALYGESKLVAKTASTLPISAGAFNLQYLLDNFGPAKSRRVAQPVHD